jgi:RNA polymerase sigma factor (sigma-70 family)
MHLNAYIAQKLVNQGIEQLRREAIPRPQRRPLHAFPSREPQPHQAVGRRDDGPPYEIGEATITTSKAVVRAKRRGERTRMANEAIAVLARAAATGDQRAWDRLVQEFSGMLWAVARAHRLSDPDASDVVQTTWLRLLEHLGGLKDPTRVGAWLATTARRECLRALRRAHRDVLLGEDPVEYESPGLAPDDELLLGERDQTLWRSFARLRESDQSLLRLLVADPQPSYEEISAALEVPIGSIGPTRARALQRLRNELERTGELTVMID